MLKVTGLLSLLVFVLLEASPVVSDTLPLLPNATEGDFLRLHERLLTNYSRHMRPLTNQSASMGVSLKFDLLSVSDIDDVKQRISVLAVVSVQWTDKNLIWDPTDYGGIDRMYFNEDHIWAPIIYIVESQTKGPTLFNLPTTHLVLPDGSVNFGSSGILETSCTLDMTYFPYDYQSCKFGFGVLDSSKRDISLVPDPRGPQKSAAYVPDGEWNVYGFSIDEALYGKINYESQTLYVVLKLQRRSTYYVLNVIVPAVTVSLLSLLTFAVPVESGERLAYALTNLLSLSVYITYIGSIMPSSSVDLPIILQYLVSLFLISSMCVVMTVVVIAIRWSQVIISGEKYKTVFLLGFPITLKCEKMTEALCRRRKIACLENNSSIECTSLNSSELQNLWDAPKENVFVETALIGKSSAVRSKPKSNVKPFVSTGTDDSRSQGPVEMKSMPKTSDDVPKAVPGVYPEYELTSGDMDPDVLRICTKVDLCSFCLLLAVFLVMTAVSFVQLNNQHSK